MLNEVRNSFGVIGDVVHELAPRSSLRLNGATLSRAGRALLRLYSTAFRALTPSAAATPAP
jgi:hypothetical protein